MSISDLNSNGIPFRMRVIEKGDQYGRTLSLTHDKDDPLIEFFDARHEDSFDPSGAPLGQSVSRYYLSTLMGGSFSKGQGLNMHNGVPDWTLSAEAVDDAQIALFEAGVIDEVKSPTLAFGYMPFRAEPPRRDIDPYPSVTPQSLVAETAAEWSEVFCVGEDKAKFITDIQEEVADGYTEEDEADNVFAVIINSDGQMRIYHEEPRYVLATHEAADVLEAHEVKLPSDDETLSL